MLDVRRNQPIRELFGRIFAEASGLVEQGRWFEHLFIAVARELPDFQVADIWTWREWPYRQRLTGLDGRDTGIDLVARLSVGQFNEANRCAGMICGLLAGNAPLACGAAKYLAVDCLFSAGIARRHP